MLQFFLIKNLQLKKCLGSNFQFIEMPQKTYFQMILKFNYVL
jgi:hypothetical protein